MFCIVESKLLIEEGKPMMYIIQEQWILKEICEVIYDLILHT